MIDEQLENLNFHVLWLNAVYGYSGLDWRLNDDYAVADLLDYINDSRFARFIGGSDR